MTHDNQTEEIDQSQRSTSREWNTGSWGHVCYQGKVQNTSVTRVAVHMGWKQTGAQIRDRSVYSQTSGLDSEQIHT